MIKELLENIRDGLVSDSILNAYCTENFGSTPYIYLGLDRQNPPSVSPCIIISNIEGGNIIGNKQSYKIMLACFVTDENITNTGKKYTYDGFLDVEIFREKIEDAIFRLRGKLGKIEVERASIPNNIFPLWSSASWILVETIKSSR